MKSVTPIKAVLIDFDGTLVTRDMLDVACGLVGREDESRRLNEAFWAGEKPGLSALIERINLLKGLSKTKIFAGIAENDFLMPGAEELLDWLNQHKIVSILNSGSIVPVLEYYQKKLGITYVVGSKPQMDGDIILGIDESAFASKNFKIDDSRLILDKEGITQDETAAIGDSPADKPVFEYAALSICINPKNGMDEFADYVIADDLSKSIPILEKTLG